jgi:hypothetical protein
MGQGEVGEHDRVNPYRTGANVSRVGTSSSLRRQFSHLTIVLIPFQP